MCVSSLSLELVRARTQHFSNGLGLVSKALVEGLVQQLGGARISSADEVAQEVFLQVLIRGERPLIEVGAYDGGNPELRGHLDGLRIESSGELPKERRGGDLETVHRMALGKHRAKLCAVEE